MLVEIMPLWPTFQKAQNRNEDLVLATLVEVKGSSYKKPGAMLLVEQNGTTHGLLSGGCLENDIAEHARHVFDTSVNKVLHYDLSDDSIFGLGAGCDGQITILLQLLSGDYQPFEALNPTHQQARETQLWLNFFSQKYPLGAYTVKKSEQLYSNHDGWQQHTMTSDTRALNYTKPPKIAICGAGADTKPLSQMMAHLHWHGVSFDHRPGLLDKKLWPDQWQCIATSVMESELLTQGLDAAIIMSHNINRDADYLRQLHEANLPFIGLLGPPQRRDKVLQKSGLTPDELGSTLHAPVGLNLGGRLPENIALSICAELQQFFFKP